MRALLGFCAVLASPVLGEDTDRFYPPAGCSGQLTVQMRGCQLTNIWTCEQDASGDSWAMFFEKSGPTDLFRIDREAQWVESYKLFPTVREDLDQPSVDPMSLTELLETGTDSFDVTTRAGDFVRRYVGYESLTGVEVQIDGELLLQTQYSMRVLDGTGALISEHVGKELVSVRHRRFFGGTHKTTDQTGEFEWDDTPVEFMYPGEAGFFAKTPRYDCHLSVANYIGGTADVSVWPAGREGERR